MKRIASLLMIMAVSASLFTGCAPGDRMNQETEDTVKKAPMAVPVKVESIARGNIEQSVYTIGSVAASKSFTVNSKNNGDVLTVNFGVGDTVKAGDVLFTIDAYDFTLDKNSKLYQLSNSLEQAKLSLDNAKKTLGDKQLLFDTGAASQMEIDNARTQVDNAEISYKNTLDNYRATTKTYESRTKDYKVTSPVDGIVTGSTIEEGMFATTQNGFTIVVAENLVVNATVASKHINEIAVGQKAKVSISTIEKLYDGVIKTVNLTGSNGSYPVEIEILKADSAVLPGMYADVHVQIEVIENIIKVPLKAVLTEGEEHVIYVVGEDSKAKRVPVTLGASVDGDTEIEGDVKVGDQIITLGQSYLSDGQLIEVKE